MLREEGADVLWIVQEALPLTPRQPEPAKLSCSETHEVPGGGGVLVPWDGV